MIHCLDRLPPTSASEIRFESQGRSHYPATAVGIFALAGLCYLKVVPHDVGKNIAITLALIGVFVFFVNLFYYTVTFRKDTREVVIRLMCAGRVLHTTTVSYDQVVLDVIAIVESPEGPRHIPTDRRPWIGFHLNMATFVFDRKYGQTITGSDIAGLKTDLGFDSPKAD